MSDVIDMLKAKIADFCKYTGEFKVNGNENYQIKFVDDIYEFVFEDDEAYAKELLSPQDILYGLFYVANNGELLLLIKIADEVNILGTILHELVHVYDFIALAEKRNIHNYRKLQEDTFFVLWSEFHASYLMYKYFVELGKDNINPLDVATEIRNKLGNYYDSSEKLDLQTAVNTTVRYYGQYMALQSQFPNDLNKHFQRFYFDRKFLKIYEFLWEHRKVECIMRDMNLWIRILKNLENLQYLLNRAWNVNGNMVLYDWNICLHGGVYDIC